MHLFSSAVGLKSVGSRAEINELIKSGINKAIVGKRVLWFEQDAAEDGMYEAQIDEPLFAVGGISIRGLYNPITKEFVEKFHFPYIDGSVDIFNEELSLERKSDKEAFMVHCCEPRREVSPIFFLHNIVEYLINCEGEKTIFDKTVNLCALSTSGKIILPVMQTEEQLNKCKAITKERNRLVDRALQGDQDAIDGLTINDYDILSNVCNRIKNEDIYSIVDTTFIPSGLECDAYSVVGKILSIKEYNSSYTGEKIYYMNLECYDIEMSLAINADDLYGTPMVGARFVGKIWLSGSIKYNL